MAFALLATPGSDSLLSLLAGMAFGIAVSLMYHRGLNNGESNGRR